MGVAHSKDKWEGLNQILFRVPLESWPRSWQNCVQEYKHQASHQAQIKLQMMCAHCIIIMPGACACEKSERELSADISHSSVQFN